jgi:Protein of unknown function (DUF3999)
MMPSPVRLASALVVCLAIGLAAQPPLPSFRFERPIVTRGAGGRRLAIDVPLLVGANPFGVMSRRVSAAGEITSFASGGASDLRLYDGNGRELGYLFVHPPSAEPEWRRAEILPVAPAETDTEKTSGFEGDFGQLSAIDRFRVAGLRPPFLKRVRLEGSGDRSHWTVLVDEGTLFDLPDEQLHQLELSFAAGTFRYVRLTWDDTRSGRLPLPSAAHARLVAQTPAPPPLTTAVAFERRSSEPGTSRFRVRLPGARLPIVGLALDVNGGHVLRRATVEEARMRGGEVGPVVIGRTTLRRVVQDNVAASELRIPIESLTEPAVDLIVDDGDNPPLDLRGVTAVFAALPWIYFESDGSELVARYGNAALAAPKYDVEAARDKLRIDTVADAKWAEPRARTTEETTGSAPPLPTVGAALDISDFKYIRPIPAGDPGLLVVPLDAPALAHSAGVARQFADVRVVDGEGRQVPFLVEHVSEPLSIAVALERNAPRPKALPETARPSSIYRIRLPIDKLPPARLALTTSARVFERRVMVAVDRPADVRRRDPWLETLASAQWVHTDQDRPTPELAIALRPVGTNELLVIVDEGDNSALPITASRLLLPAYRLRLYRDRGASLRLAYGRADMSAPRYDLALLAPQLLGVPATEVIPGGEQQGAATAAAATISPRIFWSAMSVAIVVLLALIGRLLRSETSRESGV